MKSTTGWGKREDQIETGRAAQAQSPANPGRSDPGANPVGWEAVGEVFAQELESWNGCKNLNQKTLSLNLFSGSYYSQKYFKYFG
jgi:hypothetical protein